MRMSLLKMFLLLVGLVNLDRLAFRVVYSR